MKITVLVDNHAHENLCCEHGLALGIEYKNSTLLFDTGAGGALRYNSEKLNFNLDKVDEVIISHGHKDHTGALNQLKTQRVWAVKGVESPRCSLHENADVHHIGMPLEVVDYFADKKVYVETFSEISQGIFLTGAIPRVSGEDSGGPFYFDEQGKNPDYIEDEQALLFDNGVLIQGCCHAGIINTLEYCKAVQPNIIIKKVVGGLHLLHASQERLQQTVAYLQNSSVEELYLMHCTGDSAIDYLKKNLPNCRILTPIAGDEILFG